ncbi:hypothetical protein DMENIID0001_014280 [Sergentomyia squamirostris]
MDRKIEKLCPKVWDVVDVDKDLFIRGWRNIQQMAEEVSSLPLNVKLLMSGMGFYDPVMLSTLTEKELDITEACGITLNPTGHSCGANHDCEEMIRRSLWGGHYNSPHTFKIKLGYRNVLLLVSKKIKNQKINYKPLNSTIEKKTPGELVNECSSEDIRPVLLTDTDHLIQKVNRWIKSRRTVTALRQVDDVQIKVPGKAGIQCPYCPQRCRITYHNKRWIVSNFQKHYEVHFKDYLIPDETLGLGQSQNTTITKNVKGKAAMKKGKNISLVNLKEEDYSDEQMDTEFANTDDPLQYDDQESD